MNEMYEMFLKYDFNIDKEELTNLFRIVDDNMDSKKLCQLIIPINIL